MRVVFTYELEDLENVLEVIKNYNSKGIPPMITQLNHFRQDDSGKIRLTINGNDVINLVNLLKHSQKVHL